VADRSFDLVLLGATGFAGGLTAQYLARHAPSDLRWAIAGRSLVRLETVRGGLAALDAGLTNMPLIAADSADHHALRDLAESARVVVSTVGPYIALGEPLVAACAAAGTDYLDLTGEVEFVDRMYLRHHEEAVRTGARLVHACGFDSIPHDLGAYYTVQQLPADVPITVRGYVQASAAISGGTLASILTAFSRGRASVAATRERRRVEQRPEDRSARAIAGRPHRVAVTDGWALPLATIDPQIVARSARANARYGPQFRYSHFLSVPNAWTATRVAAGAAGLFAIAQIPPARRAVQGRIPRGTGPSDEKRARSWFRVTFVGDGGGSHVVTRVSGGDPGYDETARMLGESALCLAQDELPSVAGQVTSVTAMGDALLARLTRGGITFEVVSG
jgi:saccharopine dehydrogenase (NAD+, L-glutamate forming)